MQTLATEKPLGVPFSLQTPTVYMTFLTYKPPWDRFLFALSFFIIEPVLEEHLKWMSSSQL